MSVEIFQEPSSSSSLNSKSLRSIDIEFDLDSLPTTLEVNCVRITPPCMHFDNAYEGKRYKYKMVIQNCGKHLAFVRLCEPNSKTFEFKSFPRGLHLSPGMKIVRTVKYTYTAALGVKRGFATIWVNDQEVDYYFVVTLSCAILTIEPQLLDFGRIDAVNHATSRSFFIINSGYRDTQFAIDLGRNPLELTVEPMKGTVAAKTSVEISVEVVGSREGEFMEEFWVKANPPQRVVISGTFISPKLLVRKFINSLDFTLVDFPPTYYGSSSTQPLLIKNFSSSHSMFCVMAEIKGTTMTLDEARKIDDNYLNFHITPIDGRLAALRGAVLQITFAPVVTRKREKNYSAGFLKVIRMDCRDVGHNEIRTKDNSTSSPTLVDSSVALTTNDILIDDANGSYFSLTCEDELASETFSFEHSIGVCIHGEKERAGVTLTPTFITLNELTLQKEYHRVVLVQNQSSHLPVRVKYNKVLSIDVRPNQFDLAPSDSLEVLVIIRALKLGQVTKKVTFDLLSKVSPDDRHVMRKVGVAILRIYVETKNVAKKEALGQCVECGPCRDLANKLAPDFPYRLSPEEMAVKLENEKFYIDYIRSLCKPPPPENEDLRDYALTNYKLLLRQNTKCRDAAPRPKKIISYTPFIPLLPRLLYNIKITPKSIRLRKVAAFTTITDYFQIQNLNTFPIRVLLQANKSCIVFENNARHIIQSCEKKKIPFTFSTCSIGRYYVNINVLVNDSTLYEVTAVAEAVPKTLRVEPHHIEFHEYDGHYKFFKLMNGLNAYTSFEWEVPEGSFKIYPAYGGIKAESYILCMMAYTPDLTEESFSECVLTSESGQKRILQVSRKKRKYDVAFDTYEIDVGLISLNIPVRRKLIMKNLKNFQTLFSIPGGVPVPGVKIEPQEGILDGLDSQVFIITVHINAVVEFSTEIVFLVGEREEVAIAFKGSVDFPKFSFKPDIMYFRKIAPFGFDTLAFVVRNLSKTTNYVTFPCDEFPEFTVTDNEDEHFPHIDKIVLQPSQGKVFYLHFHPYYISTYSLFLPFKINDILGPVNINSNATASTNYFLRELTTKYENNYSINILTRYPKALPLVRLTASAIEKTLEFSSLNINFVYFDEDHYNNVTSTDFEITNTSDDVAAVCIRLDDLDYPFSLQPKGNPNVEYYGISYKIVLEPGEKAAFSAQFSPSDLGEYVVKLPLFLRHYFDDKIFNYLTLRGVYDTPTITPSLACIDFEPVPVKLASEFRLKLHMNNHFENCEVISDTEVIGLHAMFEKGRRPEKGESVLPVSLVYECTKDSCFNSKLAFYCTCNARCEVTVTGVTENNLLTTHAYSHMLKESGSTDGSSNFLYSHKSSTPYLRPEYIDMLTNKNTTPYPLFPSDDDKSDYAEYMRKLRKTLENWLFTQVFYSKCYYKIPEGFSDFCKADPDRKKVRFGGIKKSKTVELPLLQLIANVCGQGIKQRLSAKFPADSTDMQWLVYTYKTNSNILHYLRGFPVHLPHVSAKLLLNYDQYVQYERTKHPERAIMDERIFNRGSKQCWIDLILQIIKTFFLFRTVELPFNDSESSESEGRFKEKQSLTQFSRQSTEDKGEYVLDVGIYGVHEKELIFWLQKCYDEESENLWKEPPPEPKELIFLDVDLRDGLILGAVTARYCPYVKPLISDMYPRPYNPEEIHHNSCILVKAWKKLKLSYVISPLTLQHCGMVEMLLLANYLYAVLPNYYPKEVITIQAPLTQGGSASIEIENAGGNEIVYHVVFFENPNHLFSANAEVIRLQPGEKKTVKVRYHAKSVLNTTTTLLFSGETPGNKYGKSVAVTVVGEADVSSVCMEIPLTVNLYQPCKVTLNTQSPFKIQTDYALLFGYQPVSKEKNVLFPWEDIKQLKTVKEFVIPDEMCLFDEEGKCTASPLICCHQIGPRDLWFYFTNPEVGDWGIKMTLTGKIHGGCFENLSLNLPDNYEHLVCRCKPKPSVHTNCPLVMYLQIPMINTPLWNARKKMLLNYVDGEELKFWSKRIFTPTGTRIMTLILNSETHQMRQVIEETVQYRVILDKPNCFITLRDVVFDDVTSEEFYRLPIHPVKNLKDVGTCRMRLQSEDKIETRFYKITFNFPEESVTVTDFAE
ncbi:cilia- and flagella-associated protein 47 [Tribolium castaneum]|uniref:cilia- and flagella-associated protein 47 n=1 Tax=Tribolium castaneum TaxID=7070 RepID=UPI0030FECE8D